jgi:hypothetical protein
VSSHPHPLHTVFLVAAQEEDAVAKVHKISVLSDNLNLKIICQVDILPGFFSGYNIMTEIYVFYSKELSLNVYNKKTLSAADIEKLNKDGFKKINIEFDAANESEAIDQLLNHYKVKKNTLEDFRKDELIPSVI